MYQLKSHRNYSLLLTLKKHRGAIKKEQCRNTGHIWYTKHRTETNSKNTTQQIKTMINTDPNKFRGEHRKGEAVSY